MVPNGWENRHLYELSTKISDGIHSTPKYVESSGIYFVNGNNLKNGVIKINEGTKNVCAENAEKHWRELTNRTILMSINGTIGNLALYNGENVVLGKSACYINVADNTDVDYIYYALKSSKTQSFYTSELTGSTIKNLSLKTIKSTKILTPPLPEQRKIANILSTWDKAIGTTERLIDNSKQQKKALMQQLLTGAHIGKRLLDDSGKKFEDEWAEVKLKSIAEIKRGAGSQYISYVESPDEGIRLIRISDFLGDSLKYIKHTKDINRFILQKGDLLIAGTGATAGIVFEVPDKLSGLAFSYNAPRIRVDEKTSKKFIYYYLKSQLILSQQLSLFTGNAQPFLDTRAIGGFRIRLPSIKEQHKIASVLSNADKEIELLVQQLVDLKQEKKALMQQLLTGKRRVLV
ncbi:MAG: type I restriction enzyme S subunit [Cocleimonas sp.]|jgi:type I restriction enzyme S subunit